MSDECRKCEYVGQLIEALNQVIEVAIDLNYSVHNNFCDSSTDEVHKLDRGPTGCLSPEVKDAQALLDELKQVSN